MANAAPRVTVAVSTYGRAALLPRLFAALEAQAPAAFEVVVLDDASPDDTWETLHALAAASPLDVRLLRHETNRGPAAGRNAAWRAARADVVAFTDDDCVPQPGWLAAGLAALGDARRVVVGRTVPNPEQAANHGPFSRTLRVEDARFFQTANVFYRRADLAAAGGFDERFTKAGGEDTDLGLRVVANGAEAVFAPDAEVWHDVRPSDFRAACREAGKWVDLPLVVRRHPAVRRTLAYKRVFWKRSHATLLLVVLGVALVAAVPKVPVGALLAVPWVRQRWGTAPLPQAFVVDLLEVGALVGGSLRHRTVFL